MPHMSAPVIGKLCVMSKAMKRFKEKDVKTQAVSDFGMTLELYIETGNETIDQNINYPLLKIYADETTEEKYLEVPSGNDLVQIPVSKVKALLEAAELDVHSESWYDKNVFNKNT